MYSYLHSPQREYSSRDYEKEREKHILKRKEYRKKVQDCIQRLPRGKTKRIVLSERDLTDLECILHQEQIQILSSRDYPSRKKRIEITVSRK
jgi:hypothetical protein